MSTVTKTPRELDNSTRSGSAVNAQNCARVIPFYPVRYAVAPADKGGYAYSHPNLQRDFPALPGIQYVLRNLRDDDGYLYIYDPDNRERILCFVYRSPDDGAQNGQPQPAQFQRLQLKDQRYDGHFKATDLVGEVWPFPYIPANEHTPSKVTVWFADALLSSTKLQAFLANTDGIRSKLGTEIDLTPWIKAFKASPTPTAAPAVKHTLRVDDLTDQHAIGLDSQPVPWSEYPHGAQLPSVAAMTLAQGGGCAHFAVALHDPVGLLSELGAWVGQAVTAWTDYNTVSQRALWASKAADALLDNAYSAAYNTSYNGDINVVGTRGTGATGQPLLAAHKEAERQGNIARNQRRTFLNDPLRQEFLQNDQTARERLLRSISQHAEPVWIFWNYSGPGAWGPALALYDVEDYFCFRALRGAIARGALALAYHEQGSAMLANQLQADGPIGVMHYAMQGNSTVAAYIEAARKSVPVAGDEAANAATQHLIDLFKHIPPDAASQQIAQVSMALLAKKGLATPDTFLNARYAAAYQVLDGSVLHSTPLTIDPYLNRLRDTVGAKGLIPFRRSKLSGAIDEAMPFFESMAIKQDQPSLDVARGLKQRLSLWHGVKLGAGALGMWVSATNMGLAVKKLGEKDGLTFANLLDAGSNAAGMVASGYGMRSAMFAVEEQRAIFAGKKDVAKLAKAAEEHVARLMIGWMSAAAFIGSAKAFWDQRNQQGGARTFTIIDASIQFAEGSVGTAWLFGRQIGGMLPKFGMDAAGEAFASFAELRAGTIGLILFAADISRVLLHYWNDQRVAEQAVTGWLDHSLWGKHTTFTSDGQERLEFMRLSCEPRIDTEGHLLEQFAKSAIPIVGEQLSMKVPARTVTVMLPNWSPQASAYLVSQHQNFEKLGIEQVFSDPGKIVVKDGVGYLTFGTQNSLGDTAVTYWPNAFSDPTSFFKVTH